jgi:tetratricopeptide (TPR) repeat protein
MSSAASQRAVLFHSANWCAGEERYAEACGLLEELIDLPGDDPTPLAATLKLIHCRARAGSEDIPKIPEAAESLSAIEAAAWMEAALSLQAAGRDVLGSEMFARLAETRSMPEEVVGHALWHVVVSQLGSDPRNAASLVPRLLEYSGEDPPAAMLWGKAIECLAHRQHLDLSDIEAIWNKLPARTSERVASGLMQAAFTLERCGHLEAARWAYQRLIVMEGVPEPVRANAHLRLGIVLDARGLWDLAIREYEAAYRLEGARGIAQCEAAFRLAQTREMNEEYTDAAEMFERLRNDALLSSSQRDQAQLRYALCLLKSGQREPAVIELERCRAESSGDTSLKADIALAEIHESLRDLARARECYERVLSNPAAEPSTRTAALNRLQKLRR